MADFGDLGQETSELMLAQALANHRLHAVRPAADHLFCLDCDEPIPLRRRETLPGVETCVDCQSIREVRR